MLEAGASADHGQRDRAIPGRKGKGPDCPLGAKIGAKRCIRAAIRYWEEPPLLPLLPEGVLGVAAVPPLPCMPPVPPLTVPPLVPPLIVPLPPLLGCVSPDGIVFGV